MSAARPRKKNEDRREPVRDRVRRLIALFARAYPDAHCELDYTTPLELLIATILSAQCTDKRVNIVTKDLFKRCRSAHDYARISSEELERIIQSTGFFRAKARSIRSCCADLLARHGGEVPKTIEELTALAGVGRKTANVVLGNAFSISEGVVVDTHVARLSARLGLTEQITPEKIEVDLIEIVPRDHWTIFSHYLIWHGRRRCTAKRPDCAGCEVQTLCPSAFKFEKVPRAEAAVAVARGARPGRRAVRKPAGARAARRIPRPSTKQ
ncbi:MAG TPA: endonuclease III [Chthoniobacteraceae bacterium]|nr:endonuclease III [Chthoniobacteraceae bacterium]